ncbi:MAG: type II toxin-antitoxin system HicB family antitoxin [Pyrinomonadaceae bacterium MAG19_C2-C3]|nr:type II toxin-antitoxin system HicB family antitoxin [Pyrinomonadaceae bacterium MAG19_C2-C3]
MRKQYNFKDAPRGVLYGKIKTVRGGLRVDVPEPRKYLVVIEENETGFGASVPDLPGCVAAAKTKQEVLELIQEAIEFHLEGLSESGQPIPQPSSSSEYVEVRAA